jgi:hypothetical protein
MNTLLTILEERSEVISKLISKPFFGGGGLGGGGLGGGGGGDGDDGRDGGNGGVGEALLATPPPRRRTIYGASKGRGGSGAALPGGARRPPCDSLGPKYPSRNFLLRARPLVGQAAQSRRTALMARDQIAPFGPDARPK